mgnify:CR=1 FL=1
MGYRSEVVLALDKKLVPALMSAFAQSPEVRDLCTVHCDDLMTDYDGEGNWCMRWESIKWYETFPEIQALEALLEAISCEDLSAYGMGTDEHDGREYEELYKFIRVGEEYDDLDQRGYAFQDIFLTRGINF